MQAHVLTVLPDISPALIVSVGFFFMYFLVTADCFHYFGEGSGIS